MRAPALLLALGAVLLLAGCRDALVDVTPAQPDPDPAPSFEYRRMYIKGPALLAVGGTAELRGEPVTEAARFRWGADGTGAFTTDAPRSARIFTIRATEPGTVTFWFQAYDARDRLVAANEKTIVFR